MFHMLKLYILLKIQNNSSVKDNRLEEMCSEGNFPYDDILFREELNIDALISIVLQNIQS